MMSTRSMAPDVVRRGGEVLDRRLAVRRGLPARLDFSPSGRTIRR